MLSRTRAVPKADMLLPMRTIVRMLIALPMLVSASTLMMLPRRPELATLTRLPTRMKFRKLKAEPITTQSMIDTELAMLARREPRASAGSLAHVDDIATLVQLFEREALRMLGPSARFRNIRHIEAELSGMFPSAPHREALNTLTGLYERWRYLPVTWHPEPNEVARGRMALEVISAGRPA